MAHDVFISYSSLDKPTADAACAALEAQGVRCWIAPRDILPSAEWGEAIIEAIENARVMVLVFSANANASRQIGREVERAVNKGLPIIPFRIENVAPERSLEYFLSSPHWLDALTPPLERHLTYLVETVQYLLERGERPVGTTHASSAAAAGPNRQTLLIGGAAIAAIAVILALVLGLFSSGGSGASASAVDSAMVGNWRVDSVLSNPGDGSTADWNVSLIPDGHYTGDITFKDQGTARYTASAGYLELHPSAAPSSYSRTPSWDQSGSTVRVLTSALVPATMLSFMTSIGGIQPGALSEFLSSTEEWRRTSGAVTSRPEAGTWERDGKYGLFDWKFSFTIGGDGRYTFTAQLKDSGRFFTKDGTFRQVSDTAGLNEGQYQVVDSSQIVFKNSAGASFAPTAQVTWRRAPKQ